MVTGTPALFCADGSRVNGAMPAKGLEEKLTEAANAAGEAGGTDASQAQTTD